MYQKIKTYCDSLVPEFSHIPYERKVILGKLNSYVKSRLAQNEPANLVYICTHNSRRSHFGQIWAKVAAGYYNIPSINSFSGGTEATAFNNNAINALKRAGFTIEPLTSDENAVYLVSYNENNVPIECFSKVYDHPKNPRKNFAAIMTCGEAEENCPFIPGADIRLSTTYDDPKTFDNTPQQEQKYDERCRQIARETMYLFSKVIE